jgi:hypothetical protein
MISTPSSVRSEEKMFCKSNTQDHLVRSLFDEHGLSILSIALTSEELAPGSIIRTFPKSEKRHPCLDSLKNLFEPAPALKTSQTTFVPITLKNSSDKISVDVIAGLAASLGDAKLDPAKVAAAFKSAGAESLSVELSSARRCDIREAELERALAGATLTAFGERCRNAGERFYAVTRTVLATKARISGNADLTATAEALAKLPAALDGKISTDIARKSKSTLEMQRVGREMVIGFRAVEIIETKNGLVLKGADQPLRLRSAQNRVHATVEDFSVDNEVLVDIAPPS